MLSFSKSTQCAFGACVSALVIAGCAGKPMGGVLPEPAQQSVPGATRQDARSWMAPEAKHEDLIYVSNAGNNTVTVYDFATHKLVGMLADIYEPFGLCSDKQGDVWVVAWGKNDLIEFAHGSTKRLKTIWAGPNDWDLYGCAVDPTSGNIAVANWGKDNWFQGDVVVFPTTGWEKPKPKVYISPNIWFYYGCSYDDKGNLYVDGWDAYRNYFVALGILPKGGKTLRSISLIPSFSPTFIGGVQWDGQYVAIGDWQWVLRFAVDGQYAYIKGYTLLTSHVPVGMFDITAIGGKQHIIAPDTAGSPYAVQAWDFPVARAPTATITDGLAYSFGVTVSAAPR
jgi:hypothetical protein